MNDLTLALLFGTWSVFCVCVGMVLRKGLFNVTVEIDASAHEYYWKPDEEEIDEADAWKHGD